MSSATANALDPSIFEVVKIVRALLIHEKTAIDVVHLLDCQVSCNWIIFYQMQPMACSLGALYGDIKHARITNDNRLLGGFQDVKIH